MIRITGKRWSPAASRPTTPGGYRAMLAVSRRHHALLKRRARDELPPELEVEYQRLHHRLNAYHKRRWPETWESVKPLGRSSAMEHGQCWRAVRRRRRRRRRTAKEAADVTRDA